MKILHITPTFYPAIGGVETVVRDLVAHLGRRGVAADVMQIAPGNSATREFLDGRVVWRRSLTPNRVIGFTSPIRSILKGYDLLHVHDPQGAAITVNVLIQGRGLKKVLSTHGGYFHTSQHHWMKKLHWGLIAPQLLNRYDEILASSTSDFAIFKHKAPGVKLVPNGVTLGNFLSVHRDDDSVNPRRWLFWGRLSINKRLDLLIRTVKQARDLGLRIDLLIAGIDFDRLVPSLRATIKNLSLESQIEIKVSPSWEELSHNIATRSVFVTASEHEGFGITLIEAMASGMIILCRDIPPLNGFVKSGENAWLLRFDGGDSDARIMRDLCCKTSSELLRAQQSARTASLVHDWKTVITQYIEVYERLLSNRMFDEDHRNG